MLEGVAGSSPRLGRQDAGGCGRLLPRGAGQNLRDPGAGGAARPGAHRPSAVLRRLPGGAQRGGPALHGRALQVPPHADLLQVRYYSGEKKAPVLTVFIGGNHEASNHLQELPYGGWVAPNIYYLGMCLWVWQV